MPWPVAPVSPLTPCGPVSPLSPLTPAGPCGPITPGSPFAPAGPCGPWGPSTTADDRTPSALTTRPAPTETTPTLEAVATGVDGNTKAPASTTFPLDKTNDKRLSGGTTDAPTITGGASKAFKRSNTKESTLGSAKETGRTLDGPTHADKSTTVFSKATKLKGFT